MTSVGSDTAKKPFPILLERVGNGETIVITRRGTAIALLTQPPRHPAADVREIITRMKRLRRGTALGPGLSSRDLVEEGRRF